MFLLGFVLEYPPCKEKRFEFLAGHRWCWSLQQSSSIFSLVRGRSGPPMSLWWTFSKNGSCDWRRSTAVKEMFLHRETSTVFRRLQFCIRRNTDLQVHRQTAQMVLDSLGCFSIYSFFCARYFCLLCAIFTQYTVYRNFWLI